MSADPTVPDARSDALLLAAFASGEPSGREAAFAELVRRHALMVLSTCRRIVGNGADAEDAGQAVFLTLAHKARALAHHPTIAGWLHRVARNISIRSRDARAARQRREGFQEASSMHSANDPWTTTRREELREVLDAGLERLSERYRLPLVLHYLEGLPQDEVAVLLGVPSGTLASLLSRGRELLRDQLSRQGVAVGALALGPLLAAEAHALELPSGFAAATAKAAGAVAGGGSALSAGASPKAAALSQACLKAMATAKLLLAAGAATLLLAVGGATVALTRDPGPAAAPAAPAPAAAPAAAAGARAPAGPAGPAAALDDPAAALLARVRALRGNDLVALLRLEPPATQALAERAWRGGATASASAGLPALVDPLLGMAISEGGRRQLMPLLAALLANLPSEQWSRAIRTVRLPAAGPPAVAGAPDTAGAQRQAAEQLLGRFAAWLAQARVGRKGDEAEQAAEHLVAALGALRSASAAEFARLELGEALVRLGAGLAELKRAAAVYGLEIDALLDSVRISAPPAPGADPSRQLLTVAFSAFGGDYRIPLLMERRDGRWLPLPGAGLPAPAAPGQDQGF
jgi:RNA polymerase sigma factor (sigma-70 family)